jgi:hypothetical protein
LSWQNLTRPGGDIEKAKMSLRDLMKKDEELLLYVAMHGARRIEATHEQTNATTH